MRRERQVENISYSIRNRGRNYISGGAANLDSVVPDKVVAQWDATIADSYSGTGFEFLNVISSPADGSEQTTHDLYLGSNSSGNAAPTFNGTAGDSGAYFDYSAANNGFSLQIATDVAFSSQPQIYLDAHKAITGKKTTFMAAFVTKSSVGANNSISFLGNSNFSTNNRKGFIIQHVYSFNRWTCRLTDGTSQVSENLTNASYNISANTAYLVFYTLSHDSGTSTHTIAQNGFTSSGSDIFSNTDDATGLMVFGNDSSFNDGALDINWKGFAVFNDELTTDEKAAIAANLGALHDQNYSY